VCSSNDRLRTAESVIAGVCGAGRRYQCVRTDRLL